MGGEVYRCVYGCNIFIWWVCLYNCVLSIIIGGYTSGVFMVWGQGGTGFGIIEEWGIKEVESGNGRW